MHMFFCLDYDGFMRWLKRLFGRGRIVIPGAVVDLEEERKESPDVFNGFVLTYYYGIYLHDTRDRIGSCDLRVGHNDELYYAGNIGYQIERPYRGHGYAREAARILMKEAEKNGMDYVLITCSPNNAASRKTIERLGAEYITTVNVPRSHWLYRRGEPVKRIYEYRIAQNHL